MADPADPAARALDELANLALRSESHEAVMPLLQAARGGLPDPGRPPIQMTVVVYTDGRTAVNYLADPRWAVATLRHLADTIEAEQEVI